MALTYRYCLSDVGHGATSDIFVSLAEQEVTHMLLRNRHPPIPVSSKVCALTSTLFNLYIIWYMEPLLAFLKPYICIKCLSFTIRGGGITRFFRRTTKQRQAMCPVSDVTGFSPLPSSNVRITEELATPGN